MDKKTIEEIIKFSSKRDWDQFHNGKDLALSLSLEVNELLEIYQWSAGDLEVSERIDKIKEELADVFMYAVLIADHYHLDIAQIVMDKIKVNERKYPVEKAYGRSDKYIKLAQEMKDDEEYKKTALVIDNNRRAIKSDYVDGKMSVAQLSKKYGFSEKLIKTIIFENSKV
ncbi:MAG: nucleotide pyrophosphohydrolase [Bacilli bacterium]